MLVFYFSDVIAVQLTVIEPIAHHHREKSVFLRGVYTRVYKKLDA